MGGAEISVGDLCAFDHIESMEGFLEAGPQFVLQSYILLRNEKRGTDLTDLEESKLARTV